MTTVTTSTSRFQPICPVPLCKEDIERTYSKFEGWADLQRHLAVRHPELVEEIGITRTVIEEDIKEDK